MSDKEKNAREREKGSGGNAGPKQDREEKKI
jgi:hypothetical protein